MRWSDVQSTHVSTSEYKPQMKDKIHWSTTSANSAIRTVVIAMQAIRSMANRMQTCFCLLSLTWSDYTQKISGARTATRR